MTDRENGPQLADTTENAPILALLREASAQHPGNDICAQCALNGSGSFAVVDDVCSNPRCVLRRIP